MNHAVTRHGKWLAVAVVLIGGFEGLRTVAYRDAVGIPTICFGETKGVRMGMKKSRAECDAMLAERIVEFDDGVDACIHVALPDNRRAAVVSLAYNIGVRAFCGSSVARRLNAGDVRGACDAFLLWNKAGGVELPGLTKRRQEERALCLKDAA
jgi:lysozyme